VSSGIDAEPARVSGVDLQYRLLKGASLALSAAIWLASAMIHRELLGQLPNPALHRTAADERDRPPVKARTLAGGTELMCTGVLRAE
jgi:hypothetical protein